MNNIGIIGFGNMGFIIVDRLKSCACNYQLSVFDKDKNKTDKISGIYVAQDNMDLVGRVNTLILAIKPQDLEQVLSEIKVSTTGKLIISIAAGITLDYIGKFLGNARLIRVMPNMPARIGKGISCLCKGKFAADKDLDFAHEVFTYFGETMIIDEDKMNTATAISGSGPGYFFDLIQAKGIGPSDIAALESFAWDIFIPELSESAKSLGFNEDQAKLLAVATAEGSVALLQTTGLTPQELVTQVASKGGTTEAGIEVLHKGGSIRDAVKAAYRRAEELAVQNLEDWLGFDKKFK